MDETTEAPKRERKGGKAGGMFKRQDLAAAVSEKTGLPKAKALAVVEAVFNTISDTLKSGQEIRLVGFGSFAVTERKSGKGRDPRTGAEIDIAQSKSVRFRAGKTLRGSVADTTPAGA